MLRNQWLIFRKAKMTGNASIRRIMSRLYKRKKEKKVNWEHNWRAEFSELWRTAQIYLKNLLLRIIVVYNNDFSWFYKTPGEKNFVFFSDEVQERSIAHEFDWNDAHLKLNLGLLNDGAITLAMILATVAAAATVPSSLTSIFALWRAIERKTDSLVKLL